jgi:hypothetical protein
MFRRALDVISHFTLPVIISKRLFSGKVEAGCGTFIIINAEGWIITAAHILADMLISKEHAREYKQYKEEVSRIDSDTKFNAKQKKKHIGRLKFNNNWIINQSYWWGRDGVSAKEWQIDKFADLAISKLEPFDGSSINNYPKFRNPSDPIQPGTSLCRLGFPFHNIQASFDESSNSFRLADGTLPMPRFPLDGIHTRYAIFRDSNTNRDVKFIETSSPGLRGQSGGPVFDIDGRICGLQSRTIHLPLGFSPKIRINEKEVQENQFINVGIATDITEILKFFKDKGVSFGTA